MVSLSFPHFLAKVLSLSETNDAVEEKLEASGLEELPDEAGGPPIEMDELDGQDHVHRNIFGWQLSSCRFNL